MALSADAVRVLQKGGSAAVIIRELETLQNTVKSLSAQMATHGNRLTDAVSLNNHVDEFNRNSWKLLNTLAEIQNIATPMQTLIVRVEKLLDELQKPKEPWYRRWFKKKEESEKCCTRKCSDSDYHSDYDSDL